MKQLTKPPAKRMWSGRTRSTVSMVDPNSPQPPTDVGESKKTYHERDLIQSLRSGNEDAFGILIDRYHSSLLRLAMAFVPNRAMAEEVVQETWVGVLAGIHRFEGRSSLKTWIFRILTNRAKTKGVREKRYVAFDDIGDQKFKEELPSADVGDHFAARAQDTQQGMNQGNRDHMTPEKLLLSKECLAEIVKAIQTLPPIQQQVIILSDVEGSLGPDICNLLNISENNRRVILHRARGKVRQLLGEYLTGNIDKPVTKTFEAAGSLQSFNLNLALNRLSI